MDAEPAPSDPTVREAVREDLPALVAMLADDPLGATRERLEEPLPGAYVNAFAAIDADPNQALLVLVDEETPVGMLQLTIIPGLSRFGTTRGLIEGVRIAASHRGRGLGRRLVEHAIERARREGCRLLQLTTDKRRPDALRFYEELGFVASHEGLKLALEP